MNKNLIGNTPMIKIFYEYKGVERYVYTKLEYYNLTGSIKDRVACRIIRKAKEDGVLKDGMPLVEATSGNTGISISALGAYYNHPVYIFMPDWVSIERKKLMESFGANIILISKEDGGFIAAVKKAKEFAEKNNAFLVNQFANEENFKTHFEETGKEILEQINEEIGAFVSGVGTGGTLMGIGKRLKAENTNTKVMALEPDKMPILSAGKMISQHKIEGIGDDFVPDLVDKNAIDDIILIDDVEAIKMAQKIAKSLGLGVGISSGANLLGAVLAREKTSNAVVTVFADDNKKYLSTDLMMNLEDASKGISDEIRLLRYESV